MRWESDASVFEIAEVRMSFDSINVKKIVNIQRVRKVSHPYFWSLHLSFDFINVVFRMRRCPMPSVIPEWYLVWCSKLKGDRFSLQVMRFLPRVTILYVYSICAVPPSLSLCSCWQQRRILLYTLALVTLIYGNSIMIFYLKFQTLVVFHRWCSVWCSNK